MTENALFSEALRFQEQGIFIGTPHFAKYIKTYIICTVKPLRFVGSSLDDLRNFPDEARRTAGFELYAVQSGFEPSDWKPMPMIGSGIKEIRIHALGEW